MSSEKASPDSAVSRNWDRYWVWGNLMLATIAVTVAVAVLLTENMEMLPVSTALNLTTAASMILRMIVSYRYERTVSKR